MLHDIQEYTKSGLMVMSSRMNKYLHKVILVTLFFALFIPVSAAESDLVMDKTFFKTFNALNSIVRDEFVEKQMNRIVIGRGTIISVSDQERYKRKYRIVVESSDAPVYGQKFLFYIFIDNKDTFDLLTVNSSFEFKGQLVGYTPLETKRNQYILDIIFMDGSTIIE